jgi:hypothetical protein
MLIYIRIIYILKKTINLFSLIILTIIFNSLNTYLHLNIHLKHIYFFYHISKFYFYTKLFVGLSLFVSVIHRKSIILNQ